MLEFYVFTAFMIAIPMIPIVNYFVDSYFDKKIADQMHFTRLAKQAKKSSK